MAVPVPPPRSPWPWIAAGLAVAQPLAAVPFDRWSSVPPGPAGSVAPLVPPAAWSAGWGVLLVLGLVWAAVGVRRPDPLIRSVVIPMSGAFAGFVLWQLALARGSGWALPAFLLLLGCLGAAAVRLRRQGAADGRAGRRLTTTLVGASAGWASTTLWIDVAAAAHRATGPLEGAAARVVLLLLLAAATTTAVLGLVLLAGSWSFTAATAVALAGMAAGCAARGFPVVALTVLDAIAVLVLATVLLRARTVPPRPLAATAGRAS